ncbi:MAG: DUF4167 domain-containing protein [Sphingomicrobium sp.]
MINNRQGGRRRGRGGQRGPNLGGNNRQDNRQRGNAAQLLEKYKNMARDAQLAGDRVQSEYYLQFADHYFRVLGESRARFEEQRRQRGEDSSDDDENDNEDESLEVSEDEREEDSQRQRPRGNGRDRPRRNERNGSRHVESEDGDEERIPMAALPPAIGRDNDDEEETVAKPKRRTRKPRNDGDEAEIAPAA